jgi:hypothetical protein
MMTSLARSWLVLLLILFPNGSVSDHTLLHSDLGFVLPDAVISF